MADLQACIAAEPSPRGAWRDLISPRCVRAGLRVASTQERQKGGTKMNSIFTTRALFFSTFFALMIVTAANEALAVPFHIRTTVYAFKDNDPAFSDFIAEPGTGGVFRATISSDGSLQRPTTLATPTEWRVSGASGLINPDGTARDDLNGYFAMGDWVFIEPLGWFHIEDICAACLSKGSIDMWTATGTYPDDIGALDIDGGRDVFVFHTLDEIANTAAELLARAADPAFWKSALWTDDQHRRVNGNGQSILVDGVALPPLAVAEPETVLLLVAGFLGLIGLRRSRQ